MPFNDPSNAAQNGDEQILQGVVAAKARRRQKEASAELEQRQEPPTGRATQYDTTTGDWLVQLPSGGTVRAQLNSNGAPIGRVPVQRNRDSQVSSISAPPTNADFAGLIEQIDVLSRDLVSLMATNIEAGDPNNETTPGVLDIPPRYPNDLYYDRDSGTLFRWNADLLNDPSNPLWEPLLQLWQGFTGSPSATVYVDGAIAINNANTIYTGTISGGWAELSTGGGGGGFEGIVLYHDTLNVSVPFGQSALTTLDLSGWTKAVDTANYYSSTNPARIVLGVGVYRVSFHFNCQNAESIDSFTHWRVEINLKSGPSNIEKQAASNDNLAVHYTSGGNFINRPTSDLSTNLDCTIDLYCPTDGWWLEFLAAQISEYEGFGGTTDAGNLSLGNGNAASISVQKIA